MQKGLKRVVLGHFGQVLSIFNVSEKNTVWKNGEMLASYYLEHWKYLRKLNNLP